MTDYLYDHKQELVLGKSVLELGAGAGLPSIAAATWGAKQVVVTDYPNEDLVENMRINVAAARNVVPRSSNIVVKVSMTIHRMHWFHWLKFFSGTLVGLRYGVTARKPAR